MSDAQIHQISFWGTVLIAAGSALVLLVGVVHAFTTRRRWLPGPRRFARLDRDLRELLGPSELGERSERRAVRLVAEYVRFRVWVRWFYWPSLAVLVVGELLHLAANMLTLLEHGTVDGWRVASNGVAFIASAFVFLFISPLLLMASPRLALVRTTLTTARKGGAITEQNRDARADRFINQIARQETRLTSYFCLSRPAGDRYTRNRFADVNNGLYTQLVDAKHNLIFDDDIDPTALRLALWHILAAVAGDPTALTAAEMASVSSPGVAEAPRSRMVYRLLAVLVVLGILAGVAAVLYVDHTAISVIFSAVVAPVVLPVIVGLSRRGWSRAEGRSTEITGPAPDADPVRLHHSEVDSISIG